MRTWVLIAVLVAALALGGVGGYVIMTYAGLSDDQRRWGDPLVREFEARGLPGAWALALGLTETRLGRSGLVNRTGTDGARGGSWGPTQISEKTARAFGYAGSMEALTADPDLAARLTAQMVAAGFAERDGPIYFGFPASAEQMATVWNAGRLPTDPGLPAHTSGTYLPTLLEFLAGIS